MRGRQRISTIAQNLYCEIMMKVFYVLLTWSKLQVVQLNRKTINYPKREKLKMKISSKEEFEKLNVFGTGAANTAYAKYFIGDSFLNPLTKAEDGLFLANVTFEPGCRNNWHIHHAKKGGGQLLICTAGEGWYQEYGKDAVSLVPGTVIVIPEGVKHWHGAKKDSWFSHIAVEMPGEECSSEWCEQVSDKEYNAL
jgi:quercetin dioxygenase-like cupin family protein